MEYIALTKIYIFIGLEENENFFIINFFFS